MTNRRQTVFFNGRVSSITNVTFDVPQSTCLGSLLFSVIPQNVAMLVNDLALYAAASSMAS